MDTTLNTSEKVGSTKPYVDGSLKVMEKILTCLQKISSESKSHFMNLLVKDDKIDNSLLEKYQYESHGFAWFET